MMWHGMFSLRMIVPSHIKNWKQTFQPNKAKDVLFTLRWVASLLAQAAAARFGGMAAG